MRRRRRAYGRAKENVPSFPFGVLRRFAFQRVISITRSERILFGLFLLNSFVSALLTALNSFVHAYSCC